MRAIVIPSFGEPEVLTLRQLPDPHPGPQQVSIRVAYVGVNYADTLARRNRYHNVELPFVPGMEVSGYIHELGEGVEGLREGQPVTAFTMRGGYAELALAQADLTFPLDGTHGSLDLTTAAAFPAVVPTAYDMLTYSAHLQAGETILIHSAAGGVGTVAGQLARYLGAGLVLGTVGSEQKIAYARSFGYDHVFLRDGFVEAVQNVTAGRGVDVVLDPSGEPTRSLSLSLLPPFGRLVVFGYASGNPDVPIEPAALMAGNKAVVGYSISALNRTNPEHTAATIRRAIDLLVEGHIRVDITDILPLEQAAIAHRRMESSATTGKLLLQVQP
ncbi:MAG: zinc-binding dehydrogenase [Chloroflexi bacterium]|nr:zinc-binding dehydrogenase [Chloroflexota bacterium]